MRSIMCSVLLLSAALPASVLAEDAQSILRKVGDKQIDRWQGVDAYVVEQSLMGNRVALGYERIEVKDPDGKVYPAFRPVWQSGGSSQCADFLDAYAQGAEMLGEGHAREVEKGMQQAGLPPGLLKATGSDPWATMDSRVMMGGMADFARSAAEGQRNMSDGSADARSAANDMADFARRARLVGQETVDGRSAYHLVADDLKRTQTADGQEFTLQTVNMWIDAQEYVPLRTKIDGIAKSGGESRPITIEKFDSDYRTVSGSRMYEPYRQVMRMSGVMDAEQQAQMAEAQQKMAEMEQQLQQMPPAQRQMVMNQMGPQMAMMKQMGSGGGFETVTEVHQITVNPGRQAAAGNSEIPCGPGAANQAAPSGAGAVVGATAAVPATAPPVQPVQETDALKAAQQACLQEKVQQAQAAQKKQRGMGRMLSAVGRAASMLGNADVAKAVGDVYSANATAGDLAAAARDLGLSDDEIAACQNP